MADDERGALHRLDDFCHRERLAAAGNAFKCLVAVAAEKSCGKFVDCLLLVACRFVRSDDVEFPHIPVSESAGSATAVAPPFFDDGAASTIFTVRLRRPRWTVTVTVSPGRLLSSAEK